MISKGLFNPFHSPSRLNSSWTTLPSPTWRNPCSKIESRSPYIKALKIKVISRTIMSSLTCTIRSCSPLRRVANRSRNNFIRTIPSSVKTVNLQAGIFLISTYNQISHLSCPSPKTHQIYQASSQACIPRPMMISVSLLHHNCWINAETSLKRLSKSTSKTVGSRRWQAQSCMRNTRAL